jgi:hypothetical protein
MSSSTAFHVAAYARQLADMVGGLPDFRIPTALARYDAIGAVLTDTVLQPGLNYKNVVAPRVTRLLADYNDACSDTRLFLGLLRAIPAFELLAWRDAEKPRRLLQLTEWLVERDIFDTEALRQWLRCKIRAEEIRQVRGIGAKSLDYLKNLVGVPTVAVDRHVRTFVFSAGIPTTDYVEIREIVTLAADLLAARADCFDYAIWLYLSETVRLRQAMA